jgi:hypothetical protein
MKRLVNTIIKAVAPVRIDSAGASPHRSPRPAAACADKAFLLRYRDTLAVFEIALAKADIPALNAAAAALTRMQADLAASGAPGRLPGEGA